MRPSERTPVCKDGSSPTTLGDSSSAYKFKVLEANAKVHSFGEFVDEPDGMLNRLEGNSILDVTKPPAHRERGGQFSATV